MEGFFYYKMDNCCLDFNYPNFAIIFFAKKLLSFT